MDNKRIDKNLPNKLTISRIVLIPVIMAVLWLPLFTSADMTKCEFISAGLFLVCAITDFIDGRLARKYNIVTDFGKFMDPLADKFLVIGALLAATLVYENFRFCLILALSIIIFRELAVSSMRLVAKNADNVVIPAALPGTLHIRFFGLHREIQNFHLRVLRDNAVFHRLFRNTLFSDIQKVYFLIAVSPEGQNAFDQRLKIDKGARSRGKKLP